MNENEFISQQRAAVERMREMNNRSRFSNDNTRKKPSDNFRNSKEKPINKNDNTPHNNSSFQNNNKPPIAQNQEQKKQKSNPPFPFLGNSGPLSFLDIFNKDGDSALIIGLLLILMSEKADKMLIFALVYILI